MLPANSGGKFITLCVLNEEDIKYAVESTRNHLKELGVAPWNPTTVKEFDSDDFGNIFFELLIYHIVFMTLSSFSKNKTFSFCCRFNKIANLEFFLILS